MLTPSGVTAAEYWDAIKADNPSYVRFTFPDQNIVLENEDIDLNTGVVVEDVLNGEVDLTFGKAVMKAVRTKIRVSSKTELLHWAGEFVLEFGVKIDDTVHYVQVGLFSGEYPKNVTTVEMAELTAYDRMKSFEILADDFFANITYPITVGELYHQLVDFVYGDTGSTHHYEDGDALTAIFNRSFDSAPLDMTGYTCRDILEWIAEAAGCYARINASGNCELVWYRDATEHVVLKSEEFGVEHDDLNLSMTWDEFDQLTWDEAEAYSWDALEGYEEVYGIRAVKIKQSSIGVDIDYPRTEPWNVYTIMDNPFLVIQDLQTDIASYIKPIYDRLSSFGGHLPISVDCVGNWCVETGDVITVQLEEETIPSPVFFRTLTWRGAVRDHYETTGQKNRTIINETQKQQVINNREIRMYVNNRYYDKRSGIDILEEGIEISGGKYIKLDAASFLQLLSGANIQIQSGGQLEILSGGKFVITSTNFGIDSNGKVSIRGSLEVLNGEEIKLNSGALLKLLSGGNMQIQSGGQLEILSGGKFVITSTNFGIDSNGKVSIRGSLEVLNGEEIKLNSGALLKLLSGGNMQIQSGGQLEIQSGGKFIITSPNFNINANGDVTINGSLATPNWVFDQYGTLYRSGNATMAIGDPNGFNGTAGGIRFSVNSSGFGVIELVSNNVYGMPASYVQLVNTSQRQGSFFQAGYDADSISLGNVSHPWYYSYIQNVRSVNSRLVFGVKMKDSDHFIDVDAYLPLYYAYTHDPDNNKELVYLFTTKTFTSGANTYNVESTLGQDGSEWTNLYVENIYYDSATQRSSRDVKHNIRAMEDFGKKIDKLNPVTFAYNDDPKENKRFGLIYEETIEEIPEICYEKDNRKDINYIDLIPILLKEVQDLRKRVAELETIVGTGKVE